MTHPTQRNTPTKWNMNNNHQIAKKITHSENRLNFMSCMLLFIAIYSFFGYMLPKAWQNSLVMIAGLGLFFYTSFKVRKINHLHIRLFVLVTAFMVLYLVSGATSVHEFGLKGAIYTSSLLLIGMLMSVQKSNWFENCWKLFLIFSIIHASFTLFSYITPNLFSAMVLPWLPYEVSSEIIWFMGRELYPGITNQTGVNAFFISVGLAIIAANIISKNNKAFVYILMLSILLTALFLTGKRGHTLANIIAFIFTTAAYSYMKGKNVLVKMVISIVSITILALIIEPMLSDVKSPLARVVMSYEEDSLLDDSGRMLLYAQAWQLFLEKPIWGWGVGAFSSFADTGTHNVYLQLLCENGVVGAVLFIMIIITNLLITLKVMKSCRNASSSRFEKYLCFSLYMQIFYIIYCMTGNPLSDGFILIIYMLGVSMSYAMRNNANCIRNAPALRTSPCTS